jgi:hypothetical protein
MSPDKTGEAPENYRFLAVLIQIGLAGFSAPVIQELTTRADHQRNGVRRK